MDRSQRKDESKGATGKGPASSGAERKLQRATFGVEELRGAFPISPPGTKYGPSMKMERRESLLA